jgi:hypothetical protein
MSGLVTPADLKRIAEEQETAKLQEALERKRRHEEEERRFYEDFMSREPQPDALERFNAVVSRAAASGLSEVKVMEFPASWCTDGGRAINNFEESWPETLQGWAKNAYAYFKQHLEGSGYKVRAQILNYPDGNLGTVGIFVSW